MNEFNLETYKKRIFKTISKYKLVEPKDKIFIGLSGGKDSGCALFFISQYLKTYKVDAEIFAFHIKLGDFIPEKVIETVKKQTEICEIELKIYDIKNYGIDYEKISKLTRPLCSSCGTIKRYLMNKISREEGATKLCTGHHGDDFIVFFMKNIIGKNIDWITKFTPYLEGKGKQLTRIRPLFFGSGEENKNFLNSIGFPYISEDICPHSLLKQKFDKRREKWYRVINQISEWQPNFKIYFLEGIIEIAKNLKEQKEPFECEVCGEPTNKRICGFCKLIKTQKDAQ
ncbi:MAG: adenine nucleotide alpha hydrolase family protein [Candidatus Omnitrophica bacterium]|nr:adenine nucleotide alpha hydrolase family protein [Candidatus Omnitrophota bacterium]MCM8809662.1 adenine nucleotide alpha hydrolase family protein [Candidatus Omnitrophota bacterium]MCM8810100.1 adenine nucleotide alpha hydrolase family protein [Candidatus Omnitrophota bacterium]MCM8832839.1 adenine nucleotide alpha hydrolase family protein [Candidatus Omnitrophota bacterium]